eukprot:scaffold97510_cov30-Tisochrysis_lutea.AAC.1
MRSHPHKDTDYPGVMGTIASPSLCPTLLPTGPPSRRRRAPACYPHRHSARARAIGNIGTEFKAFAT